MNTRIELPYADPHLKACVIPEARLSAVYRMSDVRKLLDLQREIANALQNPIGTPRLGELAHGKTKIAVLVDDMTRPTPVRQILPGVLDELAEAGFRPDQISIVIALGSHRGMTEEEISQRLGQQIVERYRVLNSRFDDPCSLTYLGTTPEGVRIEIDEEVAAADFRIGIGSIVPHGATGWSGGAKIIYPGVAGHETVMRFHFVHGLSEENMTGREECPVRLQMERWTEKVGLDFIVNTILTPDDGVYRIVAGHYRDAHRRGVAFAKEVYTKRIQEKVDIVLSISFAHDIDFWQAAKGIYGPEALVKDRGTLLLVTPCPEGIGPHPDFLERIGRDDNRDMLRGILDGGTPMPPDPISLAPAAMLARMRRRFQCSVVCPGMGKDELRQARYGSYDDVQSGIDNLLTRYPHGKVAVVMRSDLAFEA